MNENTRRFVDEKELSKHSGMSVSFWQKDRHFNQGKAPGCPFYRVGSRTVRYDLAEALAWLAKGRVSGVAEAV